MTQPAILLISSNPITRKTVRSSLSSKGYPLIEVSDAADALSQLELSSPGLVLQELGLEAEQVVLAAMIRARLGDRVPILGLVGSAAEPVAARLAAAGFDDTISKPIVAGRLLQMVDLHLSDVVSHAERFGTGKRLLLATGCLLRRNRMRRRLELYGFQVSLAEDGAHALSLAHRHIPDVIVVDVTMQTLDGFGLSLSVRRDTALRDVPVVLVSDGYIQASDRELEQRAGASQLVQYTPDLHMLIEALRENVTHPLDAPSIGNETSHDYKCAHELRAQRILDRQRLLETGRGRRRSALAAGLRVLTGISKNVLKHRDIASTLNDALVDCFDAGSITMGALYLLERDGGLAVNTVVGDGRWSFESLKTFFGHEALLRQIMDSRVATRIPSPGIPEPVTRSLLMAAQVSTLLIVPLSDTSAPVGALVMAGPSSEDSDDLVAFAEAVGGQICQVLALASAFAEGRRAHERAEQQAALLNALLQHAPDCVAHLSADGSILFVSDVMREAQPNMIVGGSWLAAHGPEDRAVAKGAFDVVTSSGEPMSYESTVRSFDGELRSYSNRLGPVRRDGQIIGAMLVARDVSAKNRAEAQLLASDRMASVGMVAASVAHEINNPLAAMLLNLELINRDLGRFDREEASKRLHKEVADAQEAGRRVIQVVRDLKIFSRSPENIVRIRVRGVLESSLRMAWNEIRHRARLVTDFAVVPPVDGDESRLGQVFLNLIINAAQAMPEGNVDRNELRVATAVDEHENVRVTVTDTGDGIPEQHRAKLFRPFFTTKPEGVGTGLGLSICDRIVRSMGGSIGFESEIGKGTTFWVVLPPTGGQTAPSVRPPPGIDMPTRRGRVMIVEDDRLFGEVVVRLLERDHDVSMVTRAQEALQLVAASPSYDVIFCDLMMPQMTGQALFREMMRVSPTQAERMVFMTGGPFTPTARDFLSSVRNHRIEKPFDLQVLQRVFTELLH
jgi:PAS domain S-box-containing protein